MTRHSSILERDQAVLLIIDVQESFRKYLPEFGNLTRNISILVEAAKILQLPVVVTEQYPQGLGNTVSEIAACLGDHQVFGKQCFSCCGDDDFTGALRNLGRHQIIVSGIEAHVCVNQTVHDLLLAGYQPHLVTDAISARSPKNKEIAIQKMTASGAVPSCVEMALFEMCVTSGTATFKAVQRLVK
ncbi:MAG TPA: hydrolase [Planktothrix sp.]|jgi:nicotinamidase-related amidase